MGGTRQFRGDSRQSRGTRQHRGETRQTPWETRQIRGDYRKGRGESRQRPGETRQLAGRFTEGTRRDSYILKSNMGRACFPPYPLSSRLAHARIDGNFLKVAAHRAAGRSTALRKPSACSERGFNAFGDRPQTANEGRPRTKKGRGAEGNRAGFLAMESPKIFVSSFVSTRFRLMRFLPLLSVLGGCVSL